MIQYFQLICEKSVIEISENPEKLVNKLKKTVI